MSQHPIAFETLVALWSRELPADKADAIEEHLFSCDECAAAAERLDNMFAAMLGTIPPVVSRALVENLSSRGLRVKELVFTQPTGNEARFTPDLDLYVFALRADLAGADRVDVEITDASGTPQLQFVHVPFDVSRGEVLVACQRHYESFDALLSGGQFKVYAHSAGNRREVGSFSIKHIWS